MKQVKVIILVGMAFITTGCLSQTNKMEKEEFNIKKSESEWKSELTSEEYNIFPSELNMRI